MCAQDDFMPRNFRQWMRDGLLEFEKRARAEFEKYK